MGSKEALLGNTLEDMVSLVANKLEGRNCSSSVADDMANSPDAQLMSFTRIDGSALIQTKETFDSLDIAFYMNIPGQYPLGSSDAC